MLAISVGVSHVAGRGAQQTLQGCQRWICSAFGVDVGAFVIGQWPLFAGDSAAIQGPGRKALARGAIKRLLPNGSHAFCRISPSRRHTCRSKAGSRHFPFAAMAGLPQGPAQISLQRLAATGKPLRSKVFQLNSSGELRPVSP